MTQIEEIWDKYSEFYRCTNFLNKFQFRQAAEELLRMQRVMCYESISEYLEDVHLEGLEDFILNAKLEAGNA